MERRQEARSAATVEPALDGLADAALVGLARARHEGAVRVIVRRHNRLLFRVARGILRDDAEAEDAVQETYVRAFAGLAGFRGDARLGTWLTRIAINVALGRLRQVRPRADLAEVDAADATRAQVVAFAAPGDPEAEASRGQVRQLLERCIDELPEAFRLVVMLRDVQGMSTEEVARAPRHPAGDGPDPAPSGAAAAAGRDRAAARRRVRRPLPVRRRPLRRPDGTGGAARAG